MGKENDFEFWLESLNRDDYDTMRDLHKCVNDEISSGGFSCTRKDDMLFVKSDYCDKTLALLSTQAKNKFLKIVHSRSIDDSSSFEEHDYYDRCMEKDD